MHKTFRYILLSTFVVSIILSSYVFWRVWQNNIEATPPSQETIKQHFDYSVSWLKTNYSEIENINNPILWWMIKQAAANTNDNTLNVIYLKYKKSHLDTNPNNLSTPMFDRFYRPRMPDIEFLSHIAPYQLFFFYGLTCDDEIGSEPIIQQQMNTGFCSMHYLHPRCITHQMMGLRFMQRYECGFDERVTSTISDLQQDIISELTWDFRVGDAFIQRVVMLADSGASHHIKPVWIKQILEAQNDDGSWDDLDPIVHLGNDKALSFTSMLPKIATPKADYHATTQGIWLLSLLLKEEMPSKNP